MNVNNPVRQQRKRKTVNYNFANWTHKPWGTTYTVKNTTGQTISDPLIKKAYMNAKGLVVGTKRKLANNGSVTGNTNSGLLKAYGFNTQKKANAAYEKIKQTVAIIPGIGNTPDTRVLRSALRGALEHFASPAVRQAHSGSLLETTSFAVGAIEAGVNVLYFDDAPLNKNIVNATGLPRTFILKSEFSLNNTIKTMETDPELRSVWKMIVGLASNKSSVAANPNNMRAWVESKTSVYKGFSGVEPDVLEWIPDAVGCPNGLINIYELKIGEGKAETEPAEAYQLVKAKRTIELSFILAGKKPPCFRLYFLPWMYSTSANKRPKFTNYKGYPGHGVAAWRILSTKDADGYQVKELSRESFQKTTGLSADVMTMSLDLLRTQEMSQLLKILQHIRRHSLGFKSTSRQTYMRTAAALRRANRVPKKEVATFGNMQSVMQRAFPGRNLPKGQDDLAVYILSLPQGKVNAKASNIVSRAFKRLAARPESKWVASANGRNLNAGNFGFTRNNNYISNAEGPGIRNNKEMQRIKAGLARQDVLNFTTRRELQGINFKEKSQGSSANAAARNAAAILNRANLNNTNATKFEALYSTFLSTHGGGAGNVMRKAIELKRNSTMNNSLKNYYNEILTSRMGAAS